MFWLLSLIHRLECSIPPSDMTKSANNKTDQCVSILVDIEILSGVIFL